MKKYLFFVSCFMLSTCFSASAQPTERLTVEEVEARFLQENLYLMAEHYNIDMADAMIVQARLWENPSFSISQLNLWSTDKQRGGEAEVIPPLWGGFGRNTEFSLEISQLVYTAGKRSKLVKRERVSREIAVQEFEELLRNLKIELRKTVNELIYEQAYMEVLERQEESLMRLIESYRKQAELGNMAKRDLLRLESSLLELENEKNEVSSALYEQQRVVKSLLHLPALSSLEVVRTERGYCPPERLQPADLLELAYEHRPDMKLSLLQREYQEKALKYEKSMRVPDIEVGITYDRFGGVWKDFIGFGVGIDLPLFNRNQGNIKSARIAIEQAEKMNLYRQNAIEHEIVEAFRNYELSYQFYRKINDNALLLELDRMLDVYTKNFADKNISILEYLDFVDAYKSNKHTLLMAQKKLDMQWEELQYVVNASLTVNGQQPLQTSPEGEAYK